MQNDIKLFEEKKYALFMMKSKIPGIFPLLMLSPF